MVELADTSDLGSDERTLVEVQVLLPALSNKKGRLRFKEATFFICDYVVCDSFDDACDVAFRGTMLNRY